MKYIIPAISILSNITTIVASGIAIWLFIAKREQISSAFKLLVNYSHQMSLSELKEKLERINEYNSNNTEERSKIINIFSEILGQIKGNKALNNELFETLIDIENIVIGKDPLDEPTKRILVAKLREQIRQLNIEKVDSYLGEKT